jgi:transposase
MARFDLTDFEWSVIELLLPNKPRGVPRVDDRRVLNGIFWRLPTGAPWADIPERYGPHTTSYLIDEVIAPATPAFKVARARKCSRSAPTAA